MTSWQRPFYHDNQVDLGQLAQEQLYLALPMKPLCGDTCRGLCPECGRESESARCVRVSTAGTTHGSPR